MRQYLDVLRDVRANGIWKPNRTGVNALSSFGYIMNFNLNDGFPILTTKKIHFKSIITELIWFIRGDTNIKFLNDRDVRIWNEWAYEKYKKTMTEEGIPYLTFQEFAEEIKHNAQFAAAWGDLGPIYGRQWRHWQAADGSKIDQLAEVVERIKKNSNDRRLIVTAWNPGDVSKMALPPCHCFFQFFVADNRLSCMLVQRSCDMFLGVPFNISSYALLTMLIAKITNTEPGNFKHVLGDTHIYENHLQQVDTQLERKPKPLPRLIIKKNPQTLVNLEKLEYDNFEFIGYDPHPAIKGDVAI